MPRPKSLLSGNLCVDRAQRAHNCQHVGSHRLEMGDLRLKIPEGRSPEHYCRACGLAILRRDVERLNALIAELEAG